MNEFVDFKVPQVPPPPRSSSTPVPARSSEKPPPGFTPLNSLSTIQMIEYELQSDSFKFILTRYLGPRRKVHQEVIAEIMAELKSNPYYSMPDRCLDHQARLRLVNLIFQLVQKNVMYLLRMEQQSHAFRPYGSA